MLFIKHRCILILESQSAHQNVKIMSGTLDLKLSDRTTNSCLLSDDLLWVAGKIALANFFSYCCLLVLNACLVEFA